MGLINFFKKIISGGAFSKMKNENTLLQQYLEFNSSIQRRWMTTGERYYLGNNDVKFGGDCPDIIGNNVSDLPDFESNKDADGNADNKLAHSYMKILVDEKVNYLLSKNYSLTSDDKKFLKYVKDILGKRFSYTFAKLGYESSNKGIAWLQPYINPEGNLKFMVIPAEQCCPIWDSNEHNELQAMIRFYNVIDYSGREPQEVTKLEYWTPNGLEFYKVYEGKLICDKDAYIKFGIDSGSPAPHYIKDGEFRYWGQVPFIPFKNNMSEFPDLRYVKTLIDNYDNSRSEVANFIQDVRNLVYVLKGYGGANLAEFKRDMNKFRAIIVDAESPEYKTGVDTINPTMDITAAQSHFEQLDRDIEKFAQSIPKSIVNLGSNPSGTALRFHYAGIDLKCNAMESEFKFGFDAILYFIKVYLSDAGLGDFSESDCGIVFNRDVAVNVDSAITNCVASKDMVSKETLLSNHPWVSDVEAEIKRMDNEKPIEVTPAINTPQHTENLQELLKSMNPEQLKQLKELLNTDVPAQSE